MIYDSWMKMQKTSLYTAFLCTSNMVRRTTTTAGQNKMERDRKS